MSPEFTPPRVHHAAAAPDATAPGGSEICLLAGDAEEATRASLVEVRLPPGVVSRPVCHRTVEEIWRGLAGFCPPAALRFGRPREI